MRPASAAAAAWAVVQGQRSAESRGICGIIIIFINQSISATTGETTIVYINGIATEEYSHRDIHFFFRNFNTSFILYYNIVKFDPPTLCFVFTWCVCNVCIIYNIIYSSTVYRHTIERIALEIEMHRCK